MPWGEDATGSGDGAMVAGVDGQHSGSSAHHRRRHATAAMHMRTDMHQASRRGGYDQIPAYLPPSCRLVYTMYMGACRAA